jgi:hypothetical protein
MSLAPMLLSAALAQCGPAGCAAGGYGYTYVPPAYAPPPIVHVVPAPTAYYWPSYPAYAYPPRRGLFRRR